MIAKSNLPWWKTIALGAYYHASYAARLRHNEDLAEQGRAPVMILFYHRVANDCANAWTTSHRSFARQLRWLSRYFEIVSLSTAQYRLQRGYNVQPCVSITFDDGYAENCEFAIPLLLEQQIPFTYFVTTRHILEGLPFPHDMALGNPLPPNTPQQIRALADAGVEIGAHTRTHADLGRTSERSQLHDEIVTSRDELEELTRQPIRYFAFPYGQHANLSTAAFEIARDCGYEAACSAYGGYNFPGDDPFHLQRIHADDDLLRLKNWVTLDPRKLRSTRRFSYEVKPVTTQELCACEF